MKNLLRKYEIVLRWGFLKQSAEKGPALRSSERLTKWGFSAAGYSRKFKFEKSFGAEDLPASLENTNTRRSRFLAKAGDYISAK
jgi:hypothetical protein